LPSQKCQNIDIKSQLESPKLLHQTTFEITYLCEIVKNRLKQKVTQIVIIYLATSSLQKNHHKFPKVAQLAKIWQTCHPACLLIIL
jgi:hypothetical protein